MTKHKIIISIINLVFILALSVCASAAAAGEKYIFILSSLANPYWQTVKHGIEDGGKEADIKLTVLSATSDLTNEENLNLCQSAISQNPSIIVLCPTTTAVGLQCLHEAQSKGIKVAVLDATISVEQAKKAGVNLSFSVGTDNVKVGAKAADLVPASCQNTAPKILILEGIAGSLNSANRVRGFKEELVRVSPHAKIISSISADWDRLRALNITADTLTRTPDLNVVFAANDVMALGAVEAVRAAKKTIK